MLAASPETGEEVRLDRGYDSEATRKRLGERRLEAGIPEKGGMPAAPLRATKRWAAGRTNSWHDARKKPVRCTERGGPVIDFRIAFSEVVIVVRGLIRRAWTHYRRGSRPCRRPRPIGGNSY